jgi:hypothetical protein
LYPIWLRLTAKYIEEHLIQINFDENDKQYLTYSKLENIGNVGSIPSF